jgi:plasmid maintenance system killer protein
MQISFTNRKLAKLLGSQKEALRTYGSENGRRILLRLQQISAAESLAELAKLPQTRVHELKQNRDEQISVDVKHPQRLLMLPDHDETPRKADGGLDWERITNVIIVEIVDTHR